MGAILFLLLFIFIIWPLCKLLWRGYVFHKRWKQATEGMRRAFEEAAAGQKEPEQPAPKKKKIDPSVGEYVKFEEIKVTTTVETQTDSTGSTIKYTEESQIEDAVWEEIR